MRRQAGETPAPLKIEAFSDIFTSSKQERVLSPWDLALGGEVSARRANRRTLDGGTPQSAPRVF
jgi:hypothetical protein